MIGVHLFTGTCTYHQEPRTKTSLLLLLNNNKSRNRIHSENPFRNGLSCRNITKLDVD